MRKTKILSIVLSLIMIVVAVAVVGGCAYATKGFKQSLLKKDRKELASSFPL